MADTITYTGPTKERLAKAAHWDVPSDTQTIAGRTITKATRSGYRSISVVEVMHRSGEIRDEQKTAFERLTKDWETSDPEQYAKIAPVRVDQEDNPFCPIGRRVDARKRYRAALGSIGMINAIVAKHCLMPLASKTTVGRMLAAGEAVSHVTAIKRGKKAIQDATMALAVHYGLYQHPPNP